MSGWGASRYSCIASYQCTQTDADWEKRLNETPKMSSSVLISNAGDEIRDNDPREMRLKL